MTLLYQNAVILENENTREKIHTEVGIMKDHHGKAEVITVSERIFLFYLVSNNRDMTLAAVTALPFESGEENVFIMEFLLKYTNPSKSNSQILVYTKMIFFKHFMILN